MRTKDVSIGRVGGLMLLKVDRPLQERTGLWRWMRKNCVGNYRQKFWKKTGALVFAFTSRRDMRNLAEWLKTDPRFP